MQRCKVCILTVAITVAFCSAISTTAHAAEVLSPEFSTETGFTGSSAAFTIETSGGSRITCKKTSSTGTAVTKETGEFHLEGKECTTSGGLITCTGEGDSSGVILLSGEWGLAAKGSKEAFLLVGLSTAHVTCATTSVQIKGWMLMPITPLETETTRYTVTAKQSRGKSEFTEYENGDGEKISAVLLVSLNSEAFKEAGAEVTEGKVTTEKTTEIKLSGSRVEFQNEGVILRIEERRRVTVTAEYLRGTLGPGTSSRLTVFINGPFSIIARGTTCEGANLNPNGTCNVEIECTGRARELGKALIKTESRFVGDALRLLECVV